MKVQRWISAVLCAVSLAGSMTVADAAAYPTVETGKSEEGVGYTLHYPKVYGMLDAKIAVVNDSWSGDGQRKEVELKLPVVASGDPFVLELTSGLTSARCPDCDKPLSMPSGSSLVNGTTYNGPCIVPLIGGMSMRSMQNTRHMRTHLNGVAAQTIDCPKPQIVWRWTVQKMRSVCGQ